MSSIHTRTRVRTSGDDKQVKMKNEKTHREAVLSVVFVRAILRVAILAGQGSGTSGAGDNNRVAEADGYEGKVVARAPVDRTPGRSVTRTPCGVPGVDPHGPRRCRWSRTSGGVSTDAGDYLWLLSAGGADSPGRGPRTTVRISSSAQPIIVALLYYDFCNPLLTTFYNSTLWTQWGKKKKKSQRHLEAPRDRVGKYRLAARLGRHWSPIADRAGRVLAVLRPFGLHFPHLLLTEIFYSRRGGDSAVDPRT